MTLSKGEGVMHMHVTLSELIQFCLLIVSVINLVYQIMKNKK